jgi:hypothetical protein
MIRAVGFEVQLRRASSYCWNDLVFQVTAALTCRFPGTAKAYHAVTECVDARLLMKAAIFTATHPEVGPRSLIMSVEALVCTCGRTETCARNMG